MNKLSTNALVNKKFGKWTVLNEEIDKKDFKHPKCKCRCDCGLIKTVAAHNAYLVLVALVITKNIIVEKFQAATGLDYDLALKTETYYF